MGSISSQASATILSGAALSAAFYVGQKVPLAVQMPAAFTGATISFSGSEDNVTYQPIFSGGALYTETVTAAKNCNLDGGALAPYPYLKVLSASNEGGDRVLVFICRVVER